MHTSHKVTGDLGGPGLGWHSPGEPLRTEDAAGHERERLVFPGWKRGEEEGCARKAEGTCPQVLL